MHIYEYVDRHTCLGTVSVWLAPKGLGASLGCVAGQGEPGEGWGGPREVPGGPGGAVGIIFFRGICQQFNEMLIFQFGVFL